MEKDIGTVLMLLLCTLPIIAIITIMILGLEESLSRPKRLPDKPLVAQLVEPDKNLLITSDGRITGLYVVSNDVFFDVDAAMAHSNDGAKASNLAKVLRAGGWPKTAESEPLAPLETLKVLDFLPALEE